MSNDAKRWGNLGIDLDGTLLFKGKRMKAPATAAVREFLDNHWEELQDCVEESNDEYWLDEIEKQKTAQQSGPPPGLVEVMNQWEDLTQRIENLKTKDASFKKFAKNVLDWSKYYEMRAIVLDYDREPEKAMTARCCSSAIRQTMFNIPNVEETEKLLSQAIRIQSAK